MLVPLLPYGPGVEFSSAKNFVILLKISEINLDKSKKMFIFTIPKNTIKKSKL